MSRSEWAVLAIVVTLTHSATCEEITSREHMFKARFPDANGWQVIWNGPFGGPASYLASAANQGESRTLSIMSNPLPKDFSGHTGKELENNFDRFEKGFLAKADGKVSSASISVAGIQARQIVARKKTPEGEDRHVVGINFFTANRSYLVSGLTRVPFNQDEDLRSFINSIEILK
jgi:hypothetical protein